MKNETVQQLKGKLLKADPLYFLIEFYGGVFLWVSRGVATVEQSFTKEKPDTVNMPMIKARDLGLVSEDGKLILPLVGFIAELSKTQQPVNQPEGD